MVKNKFYTLEPDLYLKKLKIEVQYIKTYKTFVLPFDINKLYLSMRNDSVTQNTKGNIARDDEEAPKHSESSSGHKREAREKLVAPISEKHNT